MLYNEFMIWKKHKNDILLIVALLLLAGSVWLAARFLRQEGAVVEVRAGEVTESFPLGKDREYTVEDGDHRNTIVIRSGRVCMESANCPDQVCVRTGWIEYEGETIVCLPHKIVVSLNGGGNGYDAVAD